MIYLAIDVRIERKVEMTTGSSGSADPGVVGTLANEAKDRIDAAADAAKTVASSVAETPGEVLEIAAEVLGDAGATVSGGVGEVIELLRKKAHDALTAIEEIGHVVTG